MECTEKAHKIYGFCGKIWSLFITGRQGLFWCWCVGPSYVWNVSTNLCVSSFGTFILKSLCIISLRLALLSVYGFCCPLRVWGDFYTFLTLQAALSQDFVVPCAFGSKFLGALDLLPCCLLRIGNSCDGLFFSLCFGIVLCLDAWFIALHLTYFPVLRCWQWRLFLHVRFFCVRGLLTTMSFLVRSILFPRKRQVWYQK